MRVSAYAAARRPSPMAPAVEYIVFLLAVLLILGIGVWLVGERHAARREAQLVCAREVRLEVQRKPFLRGVVQHPDPCFTLARMRGEPL